MEWNGMELKTNQTKPSTNYKWNEWNGMEWNGMEPEGMELEWTRGEWKEWNGMEWKELRRSIRRYQQYAVIFSSTPGITVEFPSRVSPPGVV